MHAVSLFFLSRVTGITQYRVQHYKSIFYPTSLSFLHIFLSRRSTLRMRHSPLHWSLLLAWMVQSTYAMPQFNEGLFY